MAEGHIILLNGTSSAGKSTLVVTLQKALDKPYLNLSIDEYLDLLHALQLYKRLHTY
jgi:chloramphenicol 3-O-phosphotransferase